MTGYGSSKFGAVSTTLTVASESNDASYVSGVIVPVGRRLAERHRTPRRCIPWRPICRDPLPQYTAATNAHDIEGMLATFVDDDPLVNDVQREFRGRDAIRAWAAREIVGDRVTIEVTSVREHYDDVIVDAEMDGDYDKTDLPARLVLTFYFTLAGDRIARLIILHNRPVGRRRACAGGHSPDRRLA
jgi:hypothetical protein